MIQFYITPVVEYCVPTVPVDLFALYRAMIGTTWTKGIHLHRRRSLATLHQLHTGMSMSTCLVFSYFEQPDK